MYSLNVQLHYLVIGINHNACCRLSLFSDFNISQSSVATSLRCGGILKEREGKEGGGK